MLWLGDFNARIGELGEISPLAQVNANISHERNSAEIVKIARGKRLIEEMENYNMTVLNGRITGDTDGNFTFQGAQGCSVIDLAFASYNMLTNVTEMKVHNSTYSTHSPCSIQIGEAEETDITYQEKMTWSPQKKDAYKAALFTQTNQDNNSLESMNKAIKQAAQDSGQMRIITSQSAHFKPWFDKECRDTKKLLNRAIYKARRVGWKMKERQAVVQLRRDYHALKKTKKDEYFDKLQKDINAIFNPEGFRKAVKACKKKTYSTNPIDAVTWENFYKTLMPARKIDITTFFDATVQQLAEPFARYEMDYILKKLASHKAPGLDGICNEFHKNLPHNYTDSLLTSFNHILNTEEIPDSWYASETVMLHKKGDKMSPKNYRPIALLSASLKFFTALISKRLSDWASENGILPECQGGFRPGRSCADQIFTLNTVIQSKLRKKAGKLYALFIDFERAFPSIQHERL